MIAAAIECKKECFGRPDPVKRRMREVAVRLEPLQDSLKYTSVNVSRLVFPASLCFPDLPLGKKAAGSAAAQPQPAAGAV